MPDLCGAIEKAISEKDSLDPEYQLHFYALHLLGQFQKRDCFPLIMEMVSLPGKVLDYLIGDTVTSTLSDILYNTYDGNLGLLKKTIQNPAVDDFARSAMLKVMAQLYLDGDLEKEEWQSGRVWAGAVCRMCGYGIPL